MVSPHSVYSVPGPWKTIHTLVNIYIAKNMQVSEELTEFSGLESEKALKELVLSTDCSWGSWFKTKKVKFIFHKVRRYILYIGCKKLTAAQVASTWKSKTVCHHLIH